MAQKLVKNPEGRPAGSRSAVKAARRPLCAETGQSSLRLHRYHKFKAQYRLNHATKSVVRR